METPVRSSGLCCLVMDSVSLQARGVADIQLKGKSEPHRQHHITSLTRWRVR